MDSLSKWVSDKKINASTEVFIGRFREHNSHPTPTADSFRFPLGLARGGCLSVRHILDPPLDMVANIKNFLNTVISFLQIQRSNPLYPEMKIRKDRRCINARQMLDILWQSSKILNRAKDLICSFQIPSKCRDNRNRPAGEHLFHPLAQDLIPSPTIFKQIFQITHFTWDETPQQVLVYIYTLLTAYQC